VEFIPAGHAAAALVLSLIGFCVGVCGGFFGVGGAFIVTPALNVLGFPMVYAIGTDLAHMAGKSIISTLRHRRAGHIDFRAAALLASGTIPGVHLGSLVILQLEKIGKTDVYVRAVYIAILLILGLFMLRETSRKRTSSGETGKKASRGLGVPPMISLPASGIKRVSIWTVIGIGLLTGFLAGFLGVGGGFIRMPALLYLLGMPTKIAVGTDLVEVIFSGAYGSYLYGKAGHVDLVAALVMLVGAALGSQIGSVATQYVEGAGIRRLFSFLILGSAAAVIMKQLGLNLAAAIILLGLGATMTAIIIYRLIVSMADARSAVEKELVS
jgi:uncharacterized membrane protein YfcA